MKQLTEALEVNRILPWNFRICAKIYIFAVMLRARIITGQKGVLIPLKLLCVIILNLVM